MLSFFSIPAGLEDNLSAQLGEAVLSVGMTALAFVAFLRYVWRGGAYEMRTMGVMPLRLVVWIAIAAVAIRRK